MGGTIGLTALTLFMGKKAKFKANKARAAATRSDMQGYWETYQKWGQDAAKDYERSISSAKSQMAASGVKAGTSQWETNLAGITSEYDKQKAGFDTGVTGSALTNWAKSQQVQPELGGDETPKAFTPLSTTDYLTKEFGALDIAEAPNTKEAATTTARQGAAGVIPGKTTGPTGSPWW